MIAALVVHQTLARMKQKIAPLQQNSIATNGNDVGKC